MREQSHSANTENIVNHDVDKVDKLQQEFNELKQILYTHVLQNSANNKNVEKYNSVMSQNLTTTTGQAVCVTKFDQSEWVIWSVVFAPKNISLERSACRKFHR